MFPPVRAFLLAACLLAAIPAALRAELPGLRLDSACFETVWAPDDAALAADPGWSDPEGRLGYVASGPEGGTALRIFSPEGRPSGVTSLKLRLGAAALHPPQVARIRAEFFIPPDTVFNIGGAKMPLGIWGGDPERQGSCSTGGCAPEDQTGFSVRLTRHGTDPDHPGVHGPSLYSYHLNRHGKRQPASHSHKAREIDRDSQEFGETFPMEVAFPLGRWFTLTMDVAMNATGPGGAAADGFADLYMHDAEGRLLGAVHAEGLVFRTDPAWVIFGPRLGDLWGGNQASPRRMPLMNTSMYSRNYEMFFLLDGRDAESCARAAGAAGRAFPTPM